MKNIWSAESNAGPLKKFLLSNWSSLAAVSVVRIERYKEKKIYHKRVATKKIEAINLQSSCFLGKKSEFGSDLNAIKLFHFSEIVNPLFANGVKHVGLTAD